MKHCAHAPLKLHRFNFQIKMDSRTRVDYGAVSRTGAGINQTAV